MLHYLPHFAVSKNDSLTTDLRVVYDGSAKVSKDSPSLNDSLHTGPSLLPTIISMLIKFRIYSVGLVADIEKAFLQIIIAQEDRDATRFLWLKDIYKALTEDNLLCLRVLFGATPSPFILNATLQYHLQHQPLNDWVVQDLLKSFYADNLATSVDDEEDSFNYYTRARAIFKEAGMNLRQWMTNSEKLKKLFTEDETATEEDLKVLGLYWNSIEDYLYINVSKLSDEVAKNHKVFTKRMVTRVVAMIYDPPGFTEPFTVTAKIMLQELWSQGFKWDDHLPEQFVKEWQSWLK